MTLAAALVWAAIFGGAVASKNYWWAGVALFLVGVNVFNLVTLRRRVR